MQHVSRPYQPYGLVCVPEGTQGAVSRLSCYTLAGCFARIPILH